MSSLSRKIQKNAENYIINEYYKNMTPDMYKEGIDRAIKMTEQRLTKEYNKQLIRMSEEYNNQLTRMGEEYNKSIRDTTLVAMDTLATEIIYELGNVLECYKEEPEYLDQKIDIVQGIYETAIKSIEDYATDKYKNDKQARKIFEKKKKTIQKVFGMEANDGEKKSK